MNELLPLCNTRDLLEGGQAVPFDVNYAGQTCRAFAIRYEGLPHAYLNRCTHVAMELDWQPASHGAAYLPATGQCAGGPCQGGLVKIALSENGGVVYWHSAYNLNPVLL
jgi:nitrite reductase/ring-hydroxylating ferredoxin subunit